MTATERSARRREAAAKRIAELTKVLEAVLRATRLVDAKAIVAAALNRTPEGSPAPGSMEG